MGFGVLLTLVVAVMFCLVSGVRANIIAVHDWDPAPNDEGWTGDAWLTLVQTGGYLDVTLPTSAGPMASDWDALVLTDVDNFFTATWPTNTHIEFDFFASNVVPAQVQVWWGNTNDTNRIWYNTVFDDISDDMSTQSWTQFGSSAFSYNTDWGSVGSQDDFLADLNAIDWIGVYILRGDDGTITENYRIDNFHLVIPEPPEVMLLAAAAIVMAGAVRKRRREVTLG